MLAQLSAEQLVLIFMALVVPVFTAGAAWAAVKGSINGMNLKVEGTNKNVAEIKQDVKTLVASDANQNVRIGKVEVKLRGHDGWIRRVERRAEER